MKDRKGTIAITFMGTGTSHGIPMIACSCPVCTSEDSRDKRHRCCLMIEYEGRVVVIDTPPEFRIQCLTYHVRRLDAVLFTHAHADHIVGLDDVRRFSALQKSAVPCYGSAQSIMTLETIFGYAFNSHRINYSEIPRLKKYVVDGPFELFGREVIPLELIHGNQRVLGYRIGNFAYCTDCNEIPPTTLKQLEGLEIFVLDALRYTPHPTHFNLEQALEAAKQIRAEKTYFTHIAHEICHADLEPKLPENIFLSYDGLRLTV